MDTITFYSLPLDILALISEFLDNKDYWNFRLSCKYVIKGTERHLIKRTPIGKCMDCMDNYGFKRIFNDEILILCEECNNIFNNKEEYYIDICMSVISPDELKLFPFMEIKECVKIGIYREYITYYKPLQFGLTRMDYCGVVLCPFCAQFIDVDYIPETGMHSAKSNISALICEKYNNGYYDKNKYYSINDLLYKKY